MTLDMNSLLAAIERIFETELPRRPHEPALHTYYGDLRQPRLLETFARYHEGMLRFATFEPSDKAVLEVGSGFGLVLVWLATQGAHAFGVEAVPWMVDDVRTYLERLPTEIRERVHVQHGSASQLPYEDSSFDLVLSIEALSHYLEYKPFLAEAHRVLRPGGKLLVVDGNNGLNPFTRRRCKHIWALHERDMVDEADPWLFVPKRQRIVQESFPQLDSADAHMLALRTAGMIRGQIVHAVRDYVESSREPKNVYKRGQLSIHPEHEMVMERLFNPYALAREIRLHGFVVKVEGYWGGARGSRLLGAANRMLAALLPLTIFAARSFRLVAIKY
jgi:SAM-dependent methyltransferase